MTARILDGREVAAQVLTAVRERAFALSQRGIQPHLAFVSIGDSAPAKMYLNRLQRLAQKNGVEVTHHGLLEHVHASDLEREVRALNEDGAIDGIIVQMPLPTHLTSADLSAIIQPRKDVDGITVQSAGKMYLGIPGHRPSTALAMIEILDYAGIDPRGAHAVILGRSKIVGHPLAELLLVRHATVTLAHRQTRDLAHFTRQADLLLVGAGAPGLVRAGMISPGVVIIDAGTNVTPDGLVGDVAFDECAAIAAAITPVPGGVGPVTNAVLLRNVIDSAEQRIG